MDVGKYNEVVIFFEFLLCFHTNSSKDFGKYLISNLDE